MRARYPENHGIHLDALISGNHHLVVYLFDRYGSGGDAGTGDEDTRTSKDFCLVVRH
jgi:hypothetical protein